MAPLSWMLLILEGKDIMSCLMLSFEFDLISTFDMAPSHYNKLQLEYACCITKMSRINVYYPPKEIIYG